MTIINEIDEAMKPLQPLHVPNLQEEGLANMPRIGIHTPSHHKRVWSRLCSREEGPVSTQKLHHCQVATLGCYVHGIPARLARSKRSSKRS